MASPQAAAIKSLYRHFVEAQTANPDMPLAEVRALIEHVGDLGAEPRGVDYIEVDCDGVRAFWLIPKGASDDHVLLCTHGGGYVTGSMYSHRRMFAHIAKAIGCRGLIVDYGLAPENPHPGPINDCMTAYQWLLNQGIKAHHIATTGDSAGGALCTAVAIAARDRGLAPPAALMPMCPWYDLEAKNPSITGKAGTDVLVNKAALDDMAKTFIAGGSYNDPLANPLQADLNGLPPVYVSVGGDEILHDDATLFADKAKAAGVEVRLDVVAEMQHVWQFMAGSAPEADHAIREMAAWVRPKLGLA